VITRLHIFQLISNWWRRTADSAVDVRILLSAYVQAITNNYGRLCCGLWMYNAIRSMRHVINIYIFKQTTITTKAIASATKRNCLHVFNVGRCSRKIFNSRRQHNRSILKAGLLLKKTFLWFITFLRSYCVMIAVFEIYLIYNVPID